MSNQELRQYFLKHRQDKAAVFSKTYIINVYNKN
ncbi:DUF6887 family protein [Cylindrospermum stagnale]